MCAGVLQLAQRLFEVERERERMCVCASAMGDQETQATTWMKGGKACMYDTCKKVGASENGGRELVDDTTAGIRAAP